MSSPEQKQLSIYASLMDEAKAKFAHINTAVSGRAGFATPIVREFCYLQIRFLCELTALSCLVAHGDIADFKSHKIGRSFSADDILHKMSELRPHFYPVPVKRTSIEKLPGGRQDHRIEGIPNSPLPKEELIKMYTRSHKHVHRGTLRGILSSDTPLDMTIDVPDIMSQVQKN